MIKTVVFTISLSCPGPFVMAQDVAAQESGRGNIPTPEVFGTTVYNAIANNNYPQLRAVSALSLDLNEMETIGSDIIKVIATKLNNNGFVDPEIGNQMLKSIRKDLGSPEGLAKQMKELQQKEPKFKESLNRLRAQAQATGVDWTKAKYLKTEASNAKLDEDIPLRTGDVFIHFKAAGKEYRIKLDDCAKTPRWGWMLGPDELQLDTVKNK